MTEFLERLFFAFMALFPILNPPAMAPVFLQLTGSVDERQRRKLALRIGVYTFALLTALLLIGGSLLRLLGINIHVIGIAGGVLLFHSAWHMLNKDPRVSESEAAEMQGDLTHKAFFPFTLPVTAGPGSIAVTLSLTPRDLFWETDTLVRFLATTCGIALASFTVWVFYRFSGAFLKRLGKTGEATFGQISAFILLAIGVQIIWNGIKGLVRTL